MTKIKLLIEALNSQDIRYCHWKSNQDLTEALSGRRGTDIDLLIHREDASHFRTILSELSFRPGESKDGDSFPSIEHHFSLDEESGVLVHVHAYYRVITGESLSKNYHFPIEDMLLENIREEQSVRLPIKSAELIVFTIRIMLKHTSLAELVMLNRYWGKVKQEVKWLLEGGSVEEAAGLIDCWLPALDTRLFSECVEAINSSTSLFRRILLGRQLRTQLRFFARHSALRNWITGVRKFTRMFIRRRMGTPKGMVPHAGGAVIAFVGPEATGKSTLLAEIKHWLSEHFAVEQIHAGKPRSSLLGYIPNVLVPALRVILPSFRSSHVEARYVSEQPSFKPKNVFPLIFAVRSVLVAYDRRTLLTRAYARAANGNIVLCDRYPNQCKGTPDSPQLSRLLVDPERHPVRRLLGRVEDRLYQEIPPPDLVISLSVPLEIALMRNRTRGKTEPEDYVRRRHALSANLDFGRTTVYKISTEQPFEKTVLEVKKAIWKIM